MGMRNRDLIRNGDSLTDLFDRFFSGTLVPHEHSVENIFSDNQKININISENEETFEVQASVPGFSKEEVSVDFDDNILTISAQKNNDKKQEDEKKKWITREFYSSKVTRRISFDNNVDCDNIKATHDNGTIHM